MTEFISRSYGQDEFEVIIKTDNKEHYKKAEDFSRKLIDHAKPQTNADRIRVMSDEELAVLLAHETYRMAKPVFDVCGYGITEEFIFAQRLEWLKQPAEGVG